MNDIDDFQKTVDEAYERSFASGLHWAFGTGDSWVCFTEDGVGLHITPIQGGIAWNWTAQSGWMQAVGPGGQAETRQEAAYAGLRALINAGLYAFDLPHDSNV